MKKRIISILLSLSVLSFTFFGGTHRRAGADPVTLICMGTIIVLATELIMMCNGGYDATAAAIGEAIQYTGESFKYVFYGEDVYDMQGNVIYHEDGPFLTGLSQISYKIQGWFDNGEIVIEDGKIKLTHEQFVEIYSQTINYMSRPTVEFKAGYDYSFLSVDISSSILVEQLPLLPQYARFTGQSFSAVYFDSEKLVFTPYCVGVTSIPTGEAIDSGYSVVRVDEGFGAHVESGTTGYFLSFEAFCAERFPLFSYPSAGQFFSQLRWSGDDISANYSYSHFFVFENGSFSVVPTSDVDISSMDSGLITTVGDYSAFLRSIDSFSVSNSTPDSVDTSLPSVIPDDATLVFPTNPDYTKPITDQVGVTDVPFTPDATVTDYVNGIDVDIDVDIDIPSFLVNKFPFCIPFDFVRFLGLLCSDPVAPVFRIPISTHPDNLEQWAGNQTIGDYIDPDSPPLFEIDEEIIIDLSVIPLVQPICYTCFIVGFVFLLLHITPKMIQH